MANIFKLTFVLSLLLVFAAIGIACAVNPDWGMKNLGTGHLRSGGGDAPFI